MTSNDENNNDQHNHHDPPAAGGMGGGIAEQARTEFNKILYHHDAPPIVVRNMTLLKDQDKSCCGRNGDTTTTTTTQSSTLETAPNFMTALLGRWLATRLGLGTPLPNIRTSSANNMVQQRDYVLKNINALLLPGEGTLLLGPSGSGKSTLLKTIGKAVEQGGTDSIRVGTLEPGRQTFPRSAAFADQGDLSLTPILTVAETIQFARACAEGYDYATDESLQVLLRLVGLDHVQNTVVGNSDIRGVSGGQKRRVKVLEQAAGDAVVCMLMDEITNGLDAASALQVCQVARASVEVFHHTAVTSLLQPSQAVFETFHRLILLSPHGEVAYSGPTSKALEHFASIGLRKSAGLSGPEFLLQCAADPAGVYLRNNPTAVLVPDALASPEALARAFHASSAGQSLQDEMEQVLNGEHQAVRDIVGKKRKGITTVPQFALSPVQQIGLLMGRGFKLVLRNPASLVRAVSAILLGLIIGTLFLNTPNDASGTRIRSGYTLSLLFISFLNSSMAGLEDLVADRITFYVHREASFYRSSTYYISNILYNIPVGWAEAGLLCVCSFFLVGMSGGVGYFFTFLVLFLFTALCGSAISRCLAYSLPTADMGTSLGPALLMLFILTTGQSPRYQDIPVWLRWLSWLSPTAYAYEGVLVRELQDRTVYTEFGEEVSGQVWGEAALGIPRIPYDQAPDALSTEDGLVAFDLYMLIVLWIVYEIIGFILLNLSRSWYGPSTKRYQVVSGMSLAAPPPDWVTGEKNEMKKICSTTLEETLSDVGSLIPRAPKIHLTVCNLVYEVDVPIVEEKEPAEKETPADMEKQETAIVHSEEQMDIFALDEEGPLLTAREYGQAGRGRASEWILQKRLGKGAVNTSLSIHSRPSSRISLQQDVMALGPAAPGRLRLLSGISASFEPGTMTALMGSSGAGKTTLLDALAGYKTSGHLTGSILLNGHPKTDANWRAIAGYCEQVDLHNPMMTIRESLLFASRLRLKTKPGASSEEADAAKAKFCENLLEWLDLKDFADILVGDEASGEGLPKHARKRLTVGVEWASNCSILFADEPTSGLDSSSAAVVVAALQRAAAQGLTVVCTIHQPSQSVFESFDSLLLLRKGGDCVYQGQISKISSYIESIAPSLKGDPDTNPADHVLEVFCGNNDDAADWPASYKGSYMYKDTLEAYEYGESNPGEDVTAIVSTLLTVPWSVKFYHVLMRALLAHWRTPAYMFIRLMWTVVSNLVVGFVFLGAGIEKDSPTDIRNTLGAIFFFVNVATVPLITAVVPLTKERAIFYRETFSGTYGRAAYGWAVQIAEIPFNLTFGLIAWAIFYWLVGLSSEGDRVIYFILMTLAAYWWFPTAGQLLAFLSPNVGTAVGLGGLLMTLMQLTMGFFIPANAIPPWYIWIYWINPMRYIQQGLIVNEFGGRPVGDAFLEGLTWSFDTRWWYCYVLVVVFASATSLGIVYATRISWLKR